MRNFAYLCNPKTKEREVLTENGVIAQLVEQRTENPCVPGSIPGDTTVNERVAEMWLSFFVLRMVINGLGMELGFLKSFTQKMATVEVVCYKYKPLKNGELPIKIKVCKDRCTWLKKI